MMNKLVGGFLFLFSFNVYALEPYHPIFPDLDGYEYTQLLEKNKNNVAEETAKGILGNDNISAEEDIVVKILGVGKRNLDWLTHINTLRTEKLSFTSPQTRTSHPISSPYIYNEKIIIDEFNELLKKLPEEMKKVLLENLPFPDNPPIADQDYLQFGRLLDSVYQGAARWSLLKPYLDYLKTLKPNDIRGFYALQNLPLRREKLRLYNDLTADLKKKISTWLMGICFNKEKDEKICQSKFEESLYIHNGDATSFYNLYVENAREIYNGFYIIPQASKRTDVVWTSQNPDLATIPFKETTPEIKKFLHNIEQEWKWKNWSLALNYVTADNVPFVEFVPGATPHVNDLAGNQITLDANQPLTEWDVQWTIRHEFGHVLGFPDCYLEFYDDNLSAIVNYQLDVTNLMCSRKGNLKSIHFEEMKKSYYKE